MKSTRETVFGFTTDTTLDFYVRSTGEYLLSPPDREAVRVVDFAEIFWCISGRGIFREAGKEFILRPGYVWYYPPKSLHDFRPGDEKFHYCWVTVAGKSAAILFDGMAIHPGINYAGGCPLHLFKTIATSLHSKSLHEKMHALSAAFEILSLVSSGRYHYTQRGGIAEEAKKIIDDHFTDPELNVEKISAMLNIHRGSLSRAFSRGCGVTLNRYLAMCRLDYSQSLLRKTDLPVHTVAKMSGFNSHEYFSRIFTDTSGMSPSEFRKLNGRK